MIAGAWREQCHDWQRRMVWLSIPVFKQNHPNETIEKSNATIETTEVPDQSSRRQQSKLVDHPVSGGSERSKWLIWNNQLRTCSPENRGTSIFGRRGIDMELGEWNGDGVNGVWVWNSGKGGEAGSGRSGGCDEDELDERSKYCNLFIISAMTACWDAIKVHSRLNDSELLFEWLQRIPNVVGPSNIMNQVWQEQSHAERADRP